MTMILLIIYKRLNLREIEPLLFCVDERMQPKLTAKLFEDLKKSIEECEPEKAKEIAQELVKTDAFNVESSV